MTETRPPLAVVGVSALFPGSSDARGFWRDILAGRDLIGDVPETHWLVEDYYDPDPARPDKTYAKRGGFLSPIAFDPLEHGVPPNVVPATDTSQLLALIAAKQLLDDAVASQFTHVDRDRVSVILGEGMSSRLFQELREKRALCYDVHSYASHYLDTGSFAVYAAVDPAQAEEACRALLEELDKVRDYGVTGDELAKAKDLSKGRLLLRLEDSRAVSGWLGGQEMLNGNVRTPDDVVADIDAVTADDIRRVAGRLLDSQRRTLAVVGPFRSPRRFEALLT